MNKKPLYTNRLIREKSPYLLQHAHNPVDWYPWSQEAFDLAKELDLPIFLSIGYATCHWCHVMERESFENIEIATLMNATFINIKVDREELPEVDSLYIEFAKSLITGSIGWPLNVILTSDLEPFFATTYLPPEANHGLIGLFDLVNRIKQIWMSDEKELVKAQAEKIVEIFKENGSISGENIPVKELINETAEIFFQIADPIFGGIAGAPKFPLSYQWNFMIRYASMTGDSRALFLSEKTLDMMHRGGIYDHLGGGFSRYSVDENWFLPHFEKMLYDNALLAQGYIEAWQISHEPSYKTIAEEILTYVVNEMTGNEGGFYSAEYADSEGHEGYFYTWTKQEIYEILGTTESELFCQFYGVTAKGNFEGRNILHTKKNLKEFCTSFSKDADELDKVFQAQRLLLWETRKKREAPFKDDKILSSWNGLMIFSMIEAGFAFRENRYIEAALKAAKFIRKNLFKEDYLIRCWRLGEGAHRATLEDYAFLIRGFLSLFEAGEGTEWLEIALLMTEILEKQFKALSGGFYQTDGQDESLILRKMSFSDGAEPSGNAIHCENLLRLYHITFEDAYLNQAEDIFKAAEPFMISYPTGYCFHMLNLMRYYDPKYFTAIIAFNDLESHKLELSQLFFDAYIPHRALIWKKNKDKEIIRLLPFLNEYPSINGKTTLYLCYKGACQKPIVELSEMIFAVRSY